MIDLEKHYRSLENMYIAAPINRFYKPRITVSHERTEIEIDITENLFHSAGAVHGSVYFKMMDDAAFFAANSIVLETFVLTSAFTTYLTKPVIEGQMKSIGKVAYRSKSQIIAESVVYNSQGMEVGRGNGIFVMGKQLLVKVPGYKE